MFSFIIYLILNSSLGRKIFRPYVIPFFCKSNELSPSSQRGCVIRSAVIGFAVINLRLSSQRGVSTASPSSISDCHHNVVCHRLRRHQSPIVITTWCVIGFAVINLRLSSPSVSSASPSSISDCHHLWCHRLRRHQSLIVITFGVIGFAVINLRLSSQRGCVIRSAVIRFSVINL
jgi:hypothetical protein